MKIRPGVKKKRRLKYISILPSFVTLMNGACGFMALVFTSRSPSLRLSLPFIRRSFLSSFAIAGYMIFLAMIMDVLDGRVARLTRTTSSFGGQLDSLSDVISFGIAPAFLMFKLMDFHLDNLRYSYTGFSMFLGRGIFFSAILYVMCAVVRLARFNVENEEDESAHMYFSGLPSPAAAGVVVSLVVLHQNFNQRYTDVLSGAYLRFELFTVIALPVITLLTGFLMVTRIRYPHLTNQILRGKKTPVTLLAFFASGILLVWNIQLAMVIGFCGFTLYGIVRWTILFINKKRQVRSGSTAGVSEENTGAPPHSGDPE